MTASRGLDIASLAAVGVIYKPLDIRALVKAVEDGFASAPHGGTASASDGEFHPPGVLGAGR